MASYLVFLLSALAIFTGTSGIDTTTCSIKIQRPGEGFEPIDEVQQDPTCTEIVLWVHGMTQSKTWFESVNFIFNSTGTSNSTDVTDFESDGLISVTRKPTTRTTESETEEGSGMMDGDVPQNFTENSGSPKVCVYVVDYRDCLMWKASDITYPIVMLKDSGKIAKRVMKAPFVVNATIVKCWGFSMGGVMCGQMSTAVTNKFQEIFAMDSPESPLPGFFGSMLDKNSTDRLIVLHTSCGFMIDREVYGHIDIFVNNDTKTDSGCGDDNVTWTGYNVTGWNPKKKCEHYIPIMMLFRMGFNKTVYELMPFTNGTTGVNMTLEGLLYGTTFNATEDGSVFNMYTVNLAEPDTRNGTCEVPVICKDCSVMSQEILFICVCIFLGGILMSTFMCCVCCYRCHKRKNRYAEMVFTSEMFTFEVISTNGSLEYRATDERTGEVQLECKMIDGQCVVYNAIPSTDV